MSVRSIGSAVHPSAHAPFQPAAADFDCRDEPPAQAFIDFPRPGWRGQAPYWTETEAPEPAYSQVMCFHGIAWGIFLSVPMWLVIIAGVYALLRCCC